MAPSLRAAESPANTQVQTADAEKASGPVTTTTGAHTRIAGDSSGITLFIRKSAGMTQRLQAHDNLYTLLEGPYQNSTRARLLQCDRLLLMAGGIGITGTIPWSLAHHNVKLCWSLKPSAQCLVDSLDGILTQILDKDIIIDGRTDIEGVVKAEAARGWKKVGVVACGPGGLCDDVRAAVAAAARGSGTVFELEVDAYTW